MVNMLTQKDYSGYWHKNRKAAESWDDTMENVKEKFLSLWEEVSKHDVMKM
jgi:hypothetical protein